VLSLISLVQPSSLISELRCPLAVQLKIRITGVFFAHEPYNICKKQDYNELWIFPGKLCSGAHIRYQVSEVRQFNAGEGTRIQDIYKTILLVKRGYTFRLMVV